MKPHDFLDLSNQLASGSTEAEWRTAISRAYYSAFHAARELLRELGFTVPRDDGAHRYLIYRLSNGQHRAAEQAGTDLDRLRSDRNVADYDLNSPISATIALRLVQVAERALRSLTELRNEPARSTVTQVMREYEQNVLKMNTWRTKP